MRISDWSSDVCSSDLAEADRAFAAGRIFGARHFGWGAVDIVLEDVVEHPHHVLDKALVAVPFVPGFEIEAGEAADCGAIRSEEHTSELQSLMRISYAVFCVKKKKAILQATQTY